MQPCALACFYNSWCASTRPQHPYYSFVLLWSVSPPGFAPDTHSCMSFSISKNTMLYLHAHAPWCMRTQAKVLHLALDRYFVVSCAALFAWSLLDADGWWSTAVFYGRGAIAKSPAAPGSPGLACSHAGPSCRAGCCSWAASTSPPMDSAGRTAGCRCWFLFLPYTRYCCPAVRQCMTIGFCLHHHKSLSHT